MNKAIQTFLGCLLAALVFASTVPAACAADPEIVGVLADAIEPNIAKSLDLSPEQLDNIQQLINQQESKVLDLHVKSRELPKAEAQELLKKSVSALEAEAFKILTVEQRSKLEQVRLNRIGLRSLAEPSIAETLGLSEGQNDQIKTILGSRIQILREVGADRVDVETQNRLRKVLTNVQFATWQAMAGGGKVRPVAESSANEAPVVAQATSEKQDTAEHNVDSKPQQAAPNAIARATNTAATSIEGRASTDQDVANLTLNFNNADWSTVLKWMAKEADLSLQLDTIPTGTFTYRDIKKYTVEQAMDIMNSVLLGKGYTLVRRQRTLLVVDLGSGDSADVTRGLIRELAELVTPDELDNRGEFELLKCLFMLSRLTPEEADKQIKALIGPQGSVIPLTSANQILVVETGGKLRLIRDMIERAENPDPSKSTRVADFDLHNVAAEEVLAIARGHLGITEEDSNSADGITISTDTLGTKIYASGRADKIQMLSEIVAKVDVLPPEGGSASVQTQQAVLNIHPIISGDPEQALNVLQTMFTGVPNVRLSLDTVSKVIIAWATPSEQKLMQETLAELGGNSTKFKMIPLKGRMDTRTMIATLEKLIGKADGEAAKSGQVPLIYGDATARTLMVKGTAPQVALVEGMVEQIEASGPSLSMMGPGVKFYPGTGKANERMIEQIQSVMEAQGKGIKIKIRSQHSDDLESRANTRRMQLGAEPLPPERPAVTAPGTQNKAPQTPASKPAQEPVPAADSKNDRVTSDDVSKTNVPLGKLVLAQADESAEEAVVSEDQPADEQDEVADVEQDGDAKKDSTIEVIKTPSGLIVTSKDPDALAQWEQMAMLMNEQMANSPVEPTVFYLKYVPAAPLADLIRQAMSGKVATESGGGGGGLIGDLASSALGGAGGGLIGSLLGGGGGGSTASGPALASGEISIIPAAHLNMLIVYANASDLDLIDKLIGVMDQEDSPLLVQTAGRPQIIPLKYAEATEVVTIVKEVFASRMAQAANAGGAAGGANRQPSPQEFFEALRGGGGRRGGAGGGNQPAPMPEPKMTITANVRNNEIVVNGPNSLFLEVKALVEQIDQGSIENQEDVVVVPVGGGVSATLLQGALQSVLGDQARTNISGQQTGQNQQRNGQNNNNNQQRNNQFQRQGGNFGGGNFGGGFGGAGFGGGGFGGGNFGGAGNFGGGNQNRGGGNFGGGNFGGGNNQQRGNNQQQRGGNNQQRGGAARTQGR